VMLRRRVVAVLMALLRFAHIRGRSHRPRISGCRGNVSVY